MMVKEFRIPMPMTLAEYKIAQLYTVMETSKTETGGGDGVEEIESKPFLNHDMGLFGIKSGQYTQKKYHLDHKVPTFVRLMTPKGSLHLFEESWNAYPYCKTVLTNDNLGERLCITIESIHLQDRGDTENALALSPEMLNQREVIFLDIADDQGPEHEPFVVTGKIGNAISKKTGRGPLHPGWYTDSPLVMTCYKLVTVEVKIFGLQQRMETFIINNQLRMMVTFHRRMFLIMDQWHGLSMDTIRQLEVKTKADLEKQRKSGQRRGSTADD